MFFWDFLQKLTYRRRTCRFCRFCSPGLEPPATAMTTPTPATPPFRLTSLQFNSSLSKEVRKEQGIFFTPKAIRDRLFEVLKLYMPNPENVLRHHQP